MPITLSDLDLEAMEIISCTIDKIMILDDEEYIRASETVLGIIRQYLGGLVMTAVSTNPLIYDAEGGRA